MGAREVGEEIRAELKGRLGDQPIGVFDNDPKLDDYDSDFGAHVQVVGATRTIIVDIPNRDDHCFWGRWADNDTYHEQPILRRGEVVDFIIGAFA